MGKNQPLKLLCLSGGCSYDGDPPQPSATSLHLLVFSYGGLYTESAVPRGAVAMGTPHGPLPGLQDLKGHWSGSMQAYGGGGGATNVDFDMKGREWKWGEYGMDTLTALGSAHSVDGIKLDDFTLVAGRCIGICAGRRWESPIGVCGCRWDVGGRIWLHLLASWGRVKCYQLANSRAL